MDATRHLVTLKPYAVELIDRTMMDLARQIAMFRPIVERFVKGEPQVLLVVEFAGEERDPLLRRLDDPEAMLGDLGFPAAVVRAEDGACLAQVTAVRRSGLSHPMSMMGQGKT